MIKVIKRDKESSEGLLRRFKQGVQRSRVLIGARKSRFVQEKLSKTAKKQSALYRIKAKNEYDKLRKLGKIEEDFKSRSRR
ncbi:hypothetical protein CL633_03065 [bacterium]|nr:hypothetical protein [bacterium]|tara:strand:+ start:899 stop:1141 length:243 start_codon:yes stop_codon:yes gene_type:complete